MRIVFIVVGCIALGLGCIGVALPILPTTPFLLLAAFCFARGSERINNWFRGTKLYKNNIETLARGEGMTKSAKRRVMITVTVIIVIAFIAMRNTKIGQICLAVVWVAHIIAFTFFVKTCPEQSEEETANDDR